VATRIARNAVQVPKGVTVTISNDNVLHFSGPKGKQSQVCHSLVKVKQSEEGIQFSPMNSSKESNALTGTNCALTRNMIRGVSEGFERKLKLVGVGYRAVAQGSKLDLSLGFSHPVVLIMPTGIVIETPSQTEIVIKGMDKQQVGQMAAKIRAIRPPEPYKGKGVRYSDEIIILKEAKKK
jgi:large subunit ribosomal protein L6